MGQKFPQPNRHGVYPFGFLSASNNRFKPTHNFFVDQVGNVAVCIVDENLRDGPYLTFSSATLFRETLRHPFWYKYFVETEPGWPSLARALRACALEVFREHDCPVTANT
jgi:hypothetical protein